MPNHGADNTEWDTDHDNQGLNVALEWNCQQYIDRDDSDQEATIYDRSKLKAGNRVAGPAIVVEMDSTALIQPGHTGEVDGFGNILIRPDSA